MDPANTLVEEKMFFEEELHQEIDAISVFGEISSPTTEQEKKEVILLIPLGEIDCTDSVICCL